MSKPRISDKKQVVDALEQALLRSPAVRSVERRPNLTGFDMQFTDGQSAEMLVANFFASAKAFAKELKQASSPRSPRCILVPVFWLDPHGDSANVKLLKSDSDQGPPSLRKYTHVERQRMVKLRKWEREVLSRAHSPAGQLTYVEAAADGARFYLANMKQVTRDMSHIGPEHGAHGFVEPREDSRSWWIAEFGEKFTAIQSFQPVRKGPRFRCLCFPSPV